MEAINASFQDGGSSTQIRRTSSFRSRYSAWFRKSKSETDKELWHRGGARPVSCGAVAATASCHSCSNCCSNSCSHHKRPVASGKWSSGCYGVQSQLQPSQTSCAQRYVEQWLLRRRVTPCLCRHRPRRNDLSCVERDVKLYSLSLTHSLTAK